MEVELISNEKNNLGGRVSQNVETVLRDWTKIASVRMEKKAWFHSGLRQAPKLDDLGE